MCEPSDTPARSQVSSRKDTHTQIHTQSDLSSDVRVCDVSTSHEAVELSGGRGSEPERRDWKQSETVQGAENKDLETEKHVAAGENPEEDHRGETRHFVVDSAEGNWEDFIFALLR